jgi:hypothetical protein
MNGSKQASVAITASCGLAFFAIVYARDAKEPGNPKEAGLAKADFWHAKTAEEVEKNIKVLNGMPDADLLPTMKFISASLGVACNFCHVSKDGQLDAAADDKKEKKTARAMIKMVRDINKTNFHGEPRVSCFTCHMGQASPQGFPSLPVVLRGPTEASASPTATPSLPSAADILNKYIDAVGGESAANAIKSTAITGTLATAGGLTGTYEADQIGFNRVRELSTTSRGSRERAVSPAGGWEKTPFGVFDLSGQQLTDVKLSPPLLIGPKLKEQYSKIQVSGRNKIDNDDVYIVEAKRIDDKHERLYFDVATGLLLRRVTDTPTMIGVIPERFDYADYRDIGGVKFPFLIRVSSVDAINPITTRTLQEVKLNVPIDETNFNRPPGS